MTRVTAPDVRPISSDSATGRRGAGVEQHLERLDVRLGQAEADRHGLPEERALEVHPAQRADDGIDLFRGSWLT